MTARNVWRWLGCLGLLAACGGDTPGKQVQVAWRFAQGEGADRAHFSTDTGWQLSLDEARVGIAALYAFAPAPEKQGALAWLERCCVSVAQAHGGLDAETGRRVLAELIEPVALDLLADEAKTLPPVAAESGVLDGLKIELGKGGDAPAELHGATVYVRGEAVKDEQRVRFAAAIVLADDAKARAVELLNLAEGFDTDVTLRVNVDPRVWFAKCEFERLPAAAGDEPVNVPADNQVGRALAIAVRSPDAFSLELEPGDTP